MDPIVLRDYQQQLLTDLRAALKVHRRVCAVMPTGAGKGQTIGAIVQGAASKGRRVLVLAHRAELIDQLTATVRAWGLEPGVIAPADEGRQERLDIASRPELEIAFQLSPQLDCSRINSEGRPNAPRG